MVYVCHYRLKAKDDNFQRLVGVLDDLKKTLKTVDGFIECEVLVYPNVPSDLLFVERWHSKDAHTKSSRQLPADIFQPLMDSISGKPIIEYLESLSR